MRNITMKVIVWLCCMFCSMSSPLWAQSYGDYQLKVSFDYIRNEKNSLCKTHFKVYSNKNGNETVLLDSYPGSVGDGKYTPTPAPIGKTYSAKDAKPDFVGFWGERGWVEWFKCKFRDDGGDIYWIDYSRPYIDVKFNKGNSGNNLYPKFDAMAHVQIHPYKIEFWYFPGDGQQGAVSQTRLLPVTDVITLKATKGFHTTNYNWQYSTDNVSWKDFPSSVTYRDSKSEVTFKGADLMSEAAFRAMIGKQNLYVRVNTVTEVKHNAIVLYPCLSVPHISAITYEPETCNNSGDAVALVTLDRALEAGEVVYIKKNNQIGESQEEIRPGETNIVRMADLPAGDYRFSLIGTYNGKLSYAGDPTHTAALTIANRPIVVHEVTAVKPVSCNEGTDASITLSGGGGNGNFVGKLYKEGISEPFQQITFKEGTKGVFTRLKTGIYRITVYDTNNCTAYQKDGSVLTHTVEIQQPAQPVNVSLEHTVLPLAFDSSDGEAIIRIDGGTQLSGGYTITWRSESGQSYSPQASSKDGENYLYTFKGLHRGNYYITVEDKNYPALVAEDKEIPCGCSDTLSFYMSAPPLLEVEIEETHFVNCHGSDEGQLTAHGKGGVPSTGIQPYLYTWYRIADIGTQEISQPNDSILSNLTAGKYQVKITDNNKITALSVPFMLTQPDSLTIRFDTGDIGCSGNETGKIKAFVKGGTQPYKYQWNREGETGDEIEALEVGYYMFKVTDDRNCQLVATVEVKAPGDLKVDTLITHPSCLQPEGGSIELKISGATAPYKVVWADKPDAGLVRKGLSSGTYYAAISDANGCNTSYSFTLAKLHEFTVSLGGDLMMCRLQSRSVEAHCDEPDVRYEWYFNNSPLSNTNKTLLIDREGTYRVVATNPQGCFAEDEITVRVSQETLNLDFTVPTLSAVGTEIHAVNLSTVAADRIQWSLPEGAVLVRQSETEVVFSIAKKGTYLLSMEGFKEGCSTIVTRTIQVAGKDEVVLPDDKQPLIKQFLVTPNPTTGYFKVLVELSRAEDYTMLLYSPTGVLMDKKEVVKTQSKVFEYEINGSLQGIYLMHLQTRSDKSVLPITVKRNR